MSAHPAPTGHTIFSTDLGFMAFAWSEAGLIRLCLPQHERAAVEKRLLARGGQLAGQAVDSGAAEVAMPAWAKELVATIRAYAVGGKVDFSTFPVALGGIDDFRLAIYAAARALTHGEVTTYGGLAKRAGHPGLARETGAALGANPVPLVIPCHRILAAGGKIGGFSAPGGAATKEKLLALEGVRLTEPKPQTSFAF